MSTSPFTITTGSNTIVLNAKRKGEAAFTVTNISGRPLRGRGIPHPLGPTTVDWLSIAGQPERDFGIGAIQQYVVQVTVPRDAASGDYTLRLDGADIANPDENFTQGPVVTFQVAPLPDQSKPFPWRIVAMAAGVLVLIVLAAIVLPRLLNPAGSQWFYIVNQMSNRCVDVKGKPATANESPLQLYDCEYSDPERTDQRWQITNDGYIVNKLSNRCIDVKGKPATANESPLQLFDCESSDVERTDQRWQITNDGYIVNQLSKKCLDVYGAPGVANELRLQLYDCEYANPAKTDQRWTLVQAK